MSQDANETPQPDPNPAARRGFIWWLWWIVIILLVTGFVITPRLDAQAARRYPPPGQLIAVNDHHVMGAWATSTGGAGKLRFLADWDAAFTKALGMDIDLSAGTLGLRSKRYSMLVEDGVVKTLNIEESPGQATVSGAAAMIEQL